MKIFIKNKKSFALILAVFVLLAFSVTGMTAISLLSRRAASNFQVDSMRAFYAAEAARNYYLEKISFAADFTASECNDGNFSKTLGGTSFSISYTNRAARSATIVFTGTTNPNNSYEITQLVEENSNTTDNVRVPALTIVDHIRKFNLIVWGSYDHLGGTTYNDGGRIYIASNCLTGCGQTCSNPGHCHSAVGQNFFANTYFNAPLMLYANYTYGCCCCCYYSYAQDDAAINYSTENRTVWGTSGTAKNTYVNGWMYFNDTWCYNISAMCGIYRRRADNTTAYGVWGTAYYNFNWGGTPTPAIAFHNTTPPNVPYLNCYSNPNNPECQNWPTATPTINRAYYDALITKAASSAIGTTLIDTSSSVRSLGGRNIFFNGDVTINTTDASPLQGPGNIIATGNITINNGAFIRERVGLIAGGNITIGTTTRIGGAGAGVLGYDSTNQLIIGAGVLIYSRGNTSLGADSRVKAFCVVDSSSFYFNLASGGACDIGPYSYSKLQGLVYAATMPAPANFGYIYGNALIVKVPSDRGQPGTSGTTWPSSGLGLGNLYDTFPAASGRGATISELPLRIRGLYNLLITTP